MDNVYTIHNNRPVEPIIYVKIKNYSKQSLNGQTAELVFKGKKYSIIRLIENNTIISGNKNVIPWHINLILRISNDCLEKTEIKKDNSKKLQW